MLLQRGYKKDAVQVFQFGKKVIGQPKMTTHIYFVDGLLIDTGQSRLRKQILNTTSSLDIKKIFITHHHEDHSGNISEIRNQQNCKVYTNSKCAALMQNLPKLSFVQKITWGNRPSFEAFVIEDNCIRTDNYNFQIIPIPGHASDMVALYEANEKWLFSADLYLHHYISYFIDNESMAQQIASLKKILALDFKFMFGGHNPQYDKPKEKLKQKLEFLEDFHFTVSDFYQRGLSANEIFKAMKLKENLLIKIASGEKLSKLNMVKSVIRDIKFQNR